ncbi:MAG: lipoate--protein ligase family protein [Sporolactobacillus sp.]
MDVLDQPVWRVIDLPLADARQSFALDDALCQSVGSGHSPAVIRLWQHDRTVALGIQDTRLPFLHNGIKLLQTAGYDCFVRNSGGLAVVLDRGILNLSLVLSEQQPPLTITASYEAMAGLIREFLARQGLALQIGEISRSYCPGRYDLSVGGRKFAGIAQRRMRGGVAVQIYLCVTGSGGARGELVRHFYEASTGEEAGNMPAVDPHVLASLEELTGRMQTIKHVAKTLTALLKRRAPLVHSSLSVEEQHFFDIGKQRMNERNAAVLPPAAD